jgi:hypothetical protein
MLDESVMVPAAVAAQAYQYTSITSVTLLDCFTIPAVMALSWFVLRYASVPQEPENSGCSH